MLASKICVLTGAASGLGKATALRLARAGARVAIIDLPSQPGAALAAAIGPHAFFAPADVTNEEQVWSGHCAARWYSGGSVGVELDAVHLHLNSEERFLSARVRKDTSILEFSHSPRGGAR